MHERPRDYAVGALPFWYWLAAFFTSGVGRVVFVTPGTKEIYEVVVSTCVWDFDWVLGSL